jgi:hypothetical protein
MVRPVALPSCPLLTSPRSGSHNSIHRFPAILFLPSTMSAASTSYEAELKDGSHVALRPLPSAATTGPDTITAENEVANHDAADMRRLGKDQELTRNFQQLSTLAFTTVIMATWETLLIVNYTALSNGGRPGFLYSYIWTIIGFAPIILSLAEMSSMYVPPAIELMICLSSSGLLQAADSITGPQSLRHRDIKSFLVIWPVRHRVFLF